MNIHDVLAILDSIYRPWVSIIVGKQMWFLFKIYFLVAIKIFLYNERNGSITFDHLWPFCSITDYIESAPITYRSKLSLPAATKFTNSDVFTEVRWQSCENHVIFAVSTYRHLLLVGIFAEYLTRHFTCLINNSRRAVNFGRLTPPKLN